MRIEKTISGKACRIEWLGSVSLITLLILLSSCDVHQFPEAPTEPDPVPEPEIYAELNLDLEYDTPLYLWEHYYDPKTGEVVERYPEAAVDEDHPGTTELFEGKLPSGLKYSTVRISSKETLASETSHVEFIHDLSDDYDERLPIKLAPGNYDIVVWSDFKELEVHPRFYNPQNFHGIEIDYDVYTANSDYRDSFRGQLSVNLDENGGDYTVLMKRPMGKYEFVTTDLSEFLDKETERRNLNTRATMDDYTVMIYYSKYHPSTYNAVEDWNANSATGVSFQTEVSITGDSEASLGFDYVFINDIQNGAVEATIVVYDKENERVAQSEEIHVPIRRDHHTLLRGAFLTMSGSGGIGIDPGYNGDHNIIH